MVVPFPLLSGVPSGASAVLDMTADFAPLLQAGVVAGLCILLLAVATAIHDTWWEPRKAQQTKPSAAPEADFPKAA